MNYILVGKNGRPSMKEVFAQVTEDCVLIINKGDYFYKYSKENGVAGKAEVLKSVPKIGKGDKLIRWGNTIKVEVDGGITYNKSSQVALGANKKKARILLQERGIDVPKTWSTVEEFLKDKTKHVKLGYIVRPSKHQQGKKLAFCKNEEEVEEAVIEFGQDSYISQFYPKTREFRVHVAHGKILIMHEKPAPADKTTVAWNRHVNHDAFIVIKWGDYDPYIAKLAINTVKALELDNGAVDILAYPEVKDIKLPKAVVCEVNTAPTLRNYAQKKYASYFDWLLRSAKRREEWNSSEFKEGKSFAWKNSQLSEKKE